MNKYLKIAVMTLISAMILVSCGKTRPVQSPIDDLTGKIITLKTEIPFKEDANIAASIRNECIIGKQLSDFTKEYSEGNKMKVNLDDTATKENSDYYLDLEIIESMSAGNAFIGHRKYTKIKGTLFKAGKEIATVRGMRKSSGGFMGGFKGSCSVLGRTVKVLGKDLSVWLRHPTKRGYIGD
jgi:hypothetical protein